MESNYQKGKALRNIISRASHASFKIDPKRPSVLKMIQDSNEDRIPELIPIRHNRMSASPFAFYRGTASIMVRDLAHQKNTGIKIQAIGDCHLMNFGGFATPERSLIFDINDFDETQLAPWEWDVKRLATSFVLAARHSKMSEEDAKKAAFVLTKTYREQMLKFSSMSMLDLWYMKIDLQTIYDNAKSEKAKKLLKDAIDKAQKGTHLQSLYKLTTSVLGSFEIAEQKPLIYHPYDLKKDKRMILNFLDQYRNTLQSDRLFIFNQYQVVDVALKVVGVGSVGTRCFVVLLMNAKEEPLFIQIKEARQSVLGPYTIKSTFTHNGQRVVEGQRLVQAASDIFLGWSTGPAGRQFYIRQLKDKKMAFDVETFDFEILIGYARLCGLALARAHAKAGHSDLISGYMGKSDELENAIADFAIKYADQTEKDYAEFMKAINAGKLKVQKNDVVKKVAIRKK